MDSFKSSHIPVVFPFVLPYFSKQEQETQLAEKGAFQKTRLTVCKMFVYTVLRSVLQLPTLVRWQVSHPLSKNVNTNIPLMHDFHDGECFVVTDCTSTCYCNIYICNLNYSNFMCFWKKTRPLQT